MSNEQTNDKYEFYRNMRTTPWLKLFPHWWSQNDLLLNAIGDEVERIKALAIFSVLNAGIKPPVMTWKESIVHKEYHLTSTLTQLSSFVTVQAPLYKTWGKITLTNNTKDEINTLQIMINQTDGLLIDCAINQGDKIVFDLETQKVTINDEPFYVNNIGDGIPYFKTVQNKAIYDEETPLHNEVVRIQFASKNTIECDIDVDIQFDNIVFTDEQNIEVTGLELVPIDHIDVYAKYEFEYNEDYNGWHKVYQKKYDKNTNVLYDMITTQLYTKEWYVEVFFKGLQYPYKVGFPCYRDADSGSMYHVNNRLDTWGEQLGLERRIYKTDIPEEDYATTFPVYYPYDIEQDYWYYKRLTNEYSWNHLAINDTTLTDTEGNNLIRLHSINPFVEDFVIHAKSTYPTDKAFQDYNQYTPVIVSEQGSARTNQQVSYSAIKNLLTYDDSETIITLYSKSGTNINDLKYQSKELWTYFDLSDLPEDVNIDNIEIIVEGSSTDNKTDKYSNNETGVIIPNLYEDNITFIPLYADKSYQLSNQVITYSSNDLSTYLKELQDYSDEVIVHKSIIGVFEGEVGKPVNIPFECYENDEFIDDITDVWIYFGDVMVDATYKDGYVTVTVPNTKLATTMTFIVKSSRHKPLTVTIDIGKITKNKYALTEDGTSYIYVDIKDEKGNIIGQEKKIESIAHYISGPSVDGRVAKVAIEDEWHTKDVRNIIQKQGIYFRNIFENENEQSQTTINVKNILLKVSYSKKKSSFLISTDIDRNVESPKLGKYSVTITNTGQTTLHTNIDIITPPNIKMETNYFDVNLSVNEEKTFYSDIYQEPEIDDGYYDVLTVCEDFTKKDIVTVYSIGMVETGIRLEAQHAKYTEPTTVTAEIVTADKGHIDGGTVEFYVNNYLIRQEVTIDENNIASITFTPEDYKFINTGLQTIEVRFSGNEKYASAKASNDIFVRKESIIIDIEANENATYLGRYDMTANVSFKDANGNKIPVTDGIVSFYANNILLGRSDLLGRIGGQEGIFSLSVEPLFLEPGKYTLWARYGDSNVYASDEQSKEIRVFGGNTNINIFDINATPTDEILIRAKISDSLLEPVQVGQATLNVYYTDNNETRHYIIQNITCDVINGVIEYPYDLKTANIDIENETINAVIEIFFGGDGFTNNTGTGNLIISKRDIVIDTPDVFYGTQHEPLGFLVKVIDANTNEPVTDGKVEIKLKKQNKPIGEATVDSDGYARIVYNSMVSVEAWDTTGKFSFVRGTDYGILYKDDTAIDLTVEHPEWFTDDNNDIRCLYAITDDNLNPKEFFSIDEDGILHYINTDEDEHINEEQSDAENYFFIDPNNGQLYRQTSSKVRLYNIGKHTLQLTYSDSNTYKKRAKTCENGLSIEPQNIDLDLHTYSLDYDETHDIICYVGNDGENNNGNVIFYIDDEEFLESTVRDNKAIIPFSKLPEIKSGRHLIKAVYMLNDTEQCYTYAILKLDKTTPTIEVNLHSPIKGEKSTLDVTINTESNKPISGFVNIYLDGQLVDYQYLYGNEGYYGVITDPYTAEDIRNEDIDITQAQLTFSILMPDDIDTNYTHYIKVEYEGNDLIESASELIEEIKQIPLDTELNVRKTYIARGQSSVIDVEVLTTEDYHPINEGFVQILNGEPTPDNRNVVSQAPVRDNKATLVWTPDMDGITYYIQYTGSTSYNKSPAITIQEANIILGDAQDYIYVSAQEDSTGNPPIYQSIQDAIQCVSDGGTVEIIDDSYTIDSTLNINKKVVITGQYDSVINLNKNIVTNGDVTFTNVVVQSDSNSGIINRGNLKIIHSVLRNNTFVSSNSNLTINRCLVYCTINANNANLDNNWWGTNQPPYNVNNHLILTMSTNELPPVIYDNIDITGKIIGANGREYDIPEVDFTLTADSGYFSIDNGKMINHTVNSTYFDASYEGNIYLTVDNQVVEQPIYDYHRKTELILEPITNIPIGYYVTFNANVYSIVDSYNEYSDINGYVDFYFDDKYIGRCDVVDNHAHISTYIKNGIEEYNVGEHTIKAKYIPEEYYFGCSQEKDINIINTNNILYVSPSEGSDLSDGTFITPFKTIQKAIERAETGYTIFLKDGEYQETGIIIDKHVTIQSYGNNVTFKNLEGDFIFKTAAPAEVNEYIRINKINFVSNQVNNLVNALGLVYMEQCLFYNNKKIVEGSGSANISYSAVIGMTFDTMPTYVKCWFGTNDPVANSINQVTMKATASKSVLYKGIIALIKGSIDTYTDGGVEYKLEKDIPLRIAEFYSDQGSLRPLQDYTYNDYAVSLLDTNDESNSGKYKIALSKNTYYINQDIEIEVNIKDAITDEPITMGAMEVVIKGSSVIFNEIIPINSGTVFIDLPPLKERVYDITCIYDDGYSITSMQDNITVKKHEINMQSIQKGAYNNHAFTIDEIVFSATDGASINEPIDVYVDEEYITTLTIENSKIIGQRIDYNTLSSGLHTLKFTNQSKSKYDKFEYTTSFSTDKINSTIIFNYDKIQKGIENTFIVQVMEDNELYSVTSGYVTVVIDGKVVADNQPLQNGIYNLSLQIDNKGQYPVYIYYNDDEDRYFSTTKTSIINVDIFKISVKDLPDPINVDIGKTILLKNNVVDASNHLVSTGYFNAYVDDILIAEKINLRVSQLIQELRIPTRIGAGEHTLKLEYIDEEDNYLDTDIYRRLIVNKIKTSISIGESNLYPNQEGYIPFNISSNYGAVTYGNFSVTIKDEYGNDKTYITPVSDNLIHQINLTVPNLPAGEYEITARYTDDTGNYQGSELTSTIRISKNTVVINPNYTTYQPQKEFVFTADIFNQNNKRIDSGYVDIYIDNVKEMEHIDVYNGQISTKMIFNVSKTYSIDIIYYDDDGYYEETSYRYDFIVDKIDIKDINVVFDEEHKVIQEVVFELFNNNEVTDGILYIYVDSIQMEIYNVTEIHKYIDLDVSYLTKGEHNIAFSYVGSKVFNDFRTQTPKTINIQPISTVLEITTNDITQEVNNEITIEGNTNVEESAILRFYIKNEDVKDADYKFIGLCGVNDDTFTFNYQLSPTLVSGLYRIKVEFSGDAYYDDAMDDNCLLTIKQQKTPISVETIDNIYYQSTIPITVTTEIPDALINLFIKDTEDNIIAQIDSLVVNSAETVDYKLNNNLIGEYKIEAIYEGSPTYEATSSECEIIIQPYTPTINTASLEVGIGGLLTLNNEVFNPNRETINTGIVKYTINEDTFDYEAGTKRQYQMPENITENITITAQYISDDTNKILDSDPVEIQVALIKNNVYLDIIQAPKYINYNETFEIKVKMSSESLLPIDVDINATGQTDATIKDNIATIKCLMETSQDEYTIEISTEANEIFNASSISYVAKLNHMNYITVDTSKEPTNTNVHKLSDAVNIIKANGIIDILTPISEDIVDINKDITINGNGNDINAVNIENTGKVIINNANMKNSSITNKGSININDCIFTDNTTAILNNNNYMEVNNCMFSNNELDGVSCIEITTPNIHTVINNCTFNQNTSTGNATCISSNRANELEISNTKFIQNNGTGIISSCIYAYGNSAFYKNIFYDNNVTTDIRVIKGQIIADKNIFSSVNYSIQFETTSTGDIDLNYWGDVSTRADIKATESIEVNNWLIGELIKDGNTITPQITQYVNTLETELTDISIKYDSFEVNE